MHAELDPYTPGSGLAPRVLAGREPDVAAFDALVARTKRQMPGRAPMLSGLRGVGKTVLLNRLRSHAEAHGWAVIQFEARPGTTGATAARRSVGQGFLRLSARYQRRAHADHFRQMLATITSFTATLGLTGFSFGIDRDPLRASSGNLELDLQDAVEDACLALRQEQRALGIFIDELQDLDAEFLEALLSVQHFANQRELPFFLVGAGLPNLPARLADVRSYAERLFDYRSIGRLSPRDAAEALRRPAETVAGDGCFPDEALEFLLRESGSYPYFIQEFGSALWATASATPFTLEDAALAAQLGRSQLDVGFFPSRWDRATPVERDYLAAMATDGESGSRTGDIARRLGRDPRSLGPARQSLIDKGIVFVPEYGRIAFSVPGMAEFIVRQEHSGNPDA